MLLAGNISFFIIHSNPDLLDAGCLFFLYSFLGANESAKQDLTMQHIILKDNADDYFNAIGSAFKTLDDKTKAETLNDVKMIFKSAIRNAEMPGFKSLIKHNYNAFIERLAGNSIPDIFIN